MFIGGEVMPGAPPTALGTATGSLRAAVAAALRMGIARSVQRVEQRSGRFRPLRRHAHASLSLRPAADVA